MNREQGTTMGGSATTALGDGVDAVERSAGAVRDELFDVLSNSRRRYVLHCLKRRDEGRVDLSELSTRVTAWEQRRSPAEIDYDDRKSVHTALAQFHLPKMDDAGVVDFQSRRNVVELTAEGDDLTLYLEAVDGADVPWSTYFASVSVLASASVFGMRAGLPLLARVPAADAAAFVTAAFLLSSLAFLYDSRSRMRVGRDGPPPERERGRRREG